MIGKPGDIIVWLYAEELLIKIKLSERCFFTIRSISSDNTLDKGTGKVWDYPEFFQN